MGTKYDFVLVVLFYTLILAEKGRAGYLDTLFGTTSEDDDIVLYTTIGFFVLSVILLIIMIICLYWLYKVVKARVKKKQEKLALEEKRRWQGGVDDIIDDAYRMVPLPRATNTLDRAYDNKNFYGNIDFINSRIS